jgi:hypothetical protein
MTHYPTFHAYHPTCQYTGKPTTIRLERRSDGVVLVCVVRDEVHVMHAHPASMKEIVEYGDTLIGLPYEPPAPPVVRIRSRRKS